MTRYEDRVSCEILLETILIWFSFKKDDDKYIIYDLGGIKEFPNDLESCKSLKNTIVESESSLIFRVFILLESLGFLNDTF